jgi:hypothetical protein
MDYARPPNGMCSCCSRCEGAAHDGSVAQLTPRLRRRIEHDFPPGSAKYVLSYLEGLSNSETADKVASVPRLR